MSLLQRLNKSQMDQSEARNRQEQDKAEAEAQRLNNEYLQAEIAKRSNRSLSDRLNGR